MSLENPLRIAQWNSLAAFTDVHEQWTVLFLVDVGNDLATIIQHRGAYRQAGNRPIRDGAALAVSHRADLEVFAPGHVDRRLEVLHRIVSGELLAQAATAGYVVPVLAELTISSRRAVKERKRDTHVAFGDEAVANLADVRADPEYLLDNHDAASICRGTYGPSVAT